MSTVIILNVIVVFFAYITQFKKYPQGLKVAFSLIFLFLAIRYNFGNDYRYYIRDFIDITSYESINYFDNHFYYEPGWLFLCRLFKPFGFFAMVAVLAFFNCVVYYRFIKNYVPIKYYWFAVFIYVFNPGFMLIHSSAMRQSIAITLFLFSFDYLYKKDAIRYFLLVIIASTIHTSAVILLPAYLLSVFNWKSNNTTGLIFFLLYLSLYLFGQSLLPDVVRLVDLYFGRYSFFTGGVELGTGLGLIFLSVQLIIILYFSKFQTSKTELIFKIAYIGFIFLPLGFLIMIIARMGMYFQVATIVVLPIILSNIKNSYLRKSFAVLIIIVTLYDFFQFFSSEIYGEHFEIYRTIFTAPAFY